MDGLTPAVYGNKKHSGQNIPRLAEIYRRRLRAARRSYYRRGAVTNLAVFSCYGRRLASGRPPFLLDSVARGGVSAPGSESYPQAVVASLRSGLPMTKRR